MKKQAEMIVWRQIAEEAFYFFSALLVLGGLVEFLFPGLFSLYVDVALVAVGWVLSLLIIIYVRR
ncbi:MAG: hypothetical protein ACM3PZ_00830 [Bacillota bacterium]